MSEDLQNLWLAFHRHEKETNDKIADLVSIVAVIYSKKLVESNRTL